MEFLEEGLCQLLTLRIAGTAATLLAFPQAAPSLHPANPFRASRSSLTAMFGSAANFSSELPGRLVFSTGLIFR